MDTRHQVDKVIVIHKRHNSISLASNSVTLKSELRGTQGHWKWYHLFSCLVVVSH